MKKIILALFFTVLCCSLFAQSRDTFLKDYVSQTWNAEDGFPGNSITDICQSKDGYIIFGSYGGIIRFDGVKIHIENKLSDEKYNFISARSLLIDSCGNLWVGSNDEGAFCIKENGQIISFTSENGLPNNSVRSFCEDLNGNIWIGTASGIACVSSQGEIIKLKGFDNIPLDNHFIANQLYCDTAGRIWIITRTEKGIFVYSDQRFERYESIHSIKNPIVTTMTQDSSGAYWFGLAPYYAVKIASGEETLYNLGSGEQKGTIVTSIYQDSSKNIWFGLDNGITIYSDGNLYYYDKSQGLADDSVVKIIEDREKNIWIATDRGGVQKLSYGKFQTTAMPTAVNAIVQDKGRNVVWLAGDNGLYCYKNNQFIENEITEYCKNVRVRHVSIMKDGSLLVSTYEKFGQLRFGLDGNVTKWTKENGITGDRVRVAEEMSNGDIYIGTTTGLSIIDSKTGKIENIKRNEVISNDYIMCLYEDEDNNVWVGTDGGGIFVLKDKKVIKTITKAENLAGNVVFKIAGYRDNEIWISTGSGVSRYKDGDLFTFNSSNGFGTDGIFQLIPDFSGRMWGTSNRGIFYVKSEDIENVIEGKKTFVNTKYYNRLDGITSGGVTSTSLSMKDDLGRIWFTLIDGFTIFDPVRNSTKNTAPEVKIEEIFVDQERIEPSNGKIVLKPSAKKIMINFTGISFISPSQILFQVKLEGFDKEFTDWSNLRMASYTNLKPGKYKLLVQAQNGDEILCRAPAELVIEKIPYIWERPWFDILVLLLIVALIAFLVFRKITNLKKQKEESEKLAFEIIQALVGTIDAKDKYTKGHSRRVANYSVKLAKELGLSEEEKKQIFYMALLHDIGKIGIPDAIINKTGKLTTEEYEIVKTHPETGSKILSSISIMPNISVGAQSHHENYDGTGYPCGIKGDEIPLEARIIRVADAYDAMASNRSYRPIMEQKAVRAEIEKNIGIQFDPEIAKKMLEIIDADYEYDLKED